MLSEMLLKRVSEQRFKREQCISLRCGFCSHKRHHDVKNQEYIKSFVSRASEKTFSVPLCAGIQASKCIQLQIYSVNRHTCKNETRNKLKLQQVRWPAIFCFPLVRQFPPPIRFLKSTFCKLVNGFTDDTNSIQPSLLAV